MKTRAFKSKLTAIAIMVVAVLGSVLFFACEEKEDNTKNNAKSNPLANTEWKLISFVDVANNTTTTPMPNDSICYRIKFEENMLLNMHSSTNTFNGNYTINLQDSSINIGSLQGTEINELYDGILFVESVTNVSSFSIRANILLLYYHNNQNYLKFERR